MSVKRKAIRRENTAGRANRIHRERVAPPRPVRLGVILSHPCPDCGWHMVLRRERDTLLYRCARAACGAAHGASQETGEPLGVPADRETRRARKQAHDDFDRLWMVGTGTAKDMRKRAELRPLAYRWLADKMGLTRFSCHIGRFSLEQCRECSRLVKEELSTYDGMVRWCQQSSNN